LIPVSTAITNPKDYGLIEESIFGDTLTEEGEKFAKANGITDAVVKDKMIVSAGAAGVTKTTIFGSTLTGVPAHIASGFLWAAGLIGAVQLLGPIVGLDEEEISGATKAILAGVTVWKGLASIAELGGNVGGYKTLATAAPWIGIGVGVAVFLMTYKKEKEKVVQFTCQPWQAPTGGQSCEECNDKDLPCSEYQCKSLGQACELINPGTGEEKCVWVNRQDVNPPTIEPLLSALLDNYRYSPDNTINPPDRGVIINYLESRDNCIPAFTPLRFGVDLNEPAKCKIDILRKNNFENMSVFMSSGLLKYNHTYSLSLPGSEALEAENITIQNDGNYELYVRCEDANGNSNVATFAFKYCVDDGPDTTPPLIVTTNILNNMPIAFNQSSVDLDVFTNEPSKCMWSHNNQNYENMDEEMTCSSNIFEYNAQMLYKCSTKLTGLKDRVENNFYFRCQDKQGFPENERNTNTESYEFTLIGTQPLVIDSVNPNDTTISDSTDSIKVPIKVKTSAGHNEGESVCYYSDTGEESNYIKFFETGTFEHTQDLFLTEGDYDYFIKCTDFGGNSDYETINFSVETDTSSPQVVRAYKEENYLKLITIEEAQCVYSTFGCNYDISEGTKITVIDEKNHFTDWDVQSDLYVKCQDNFGNQPLPNQCSIIVRASNF
jgi:hypothetical protein